MKNPKKVLRRQKKRITPKECYFCKEKKEPAFSDVGTLQRFLTERGKIASRVRSGVCAKHQRIITRNIKYARHLALLPFVARG